MHARSGSNDASGLAYSMEHAADLVLPCLDCAEARFVLEVGQVALGRTQEHLRRLEAVLQRLLDSSAFSVAEWLSRLRMGARIAPEQEVVSKDAIRRALRATTGALEAIEALASANGSDGEAARSSARSSSQ
jgi:hypothetical protein